MEQQYITHLAEAYKRGYEIKYNNRQDTPEIKMHYFKVKEDLPRVQVVLEFLQGIVSAGQCQSLLDVGSGRGVFLFPLLREFPDLEVTSLDIMSHRVELLQCLHDGGIANLYPIQADICTWDALDKSFDVVTMLEVMEQKNSTYFTPYQKYFFDICDFSGACRRIREKTSFLQVFNSRCLRSLENAQIAKLDNG